MQLKMACLSVWLLTSCHSNTVFKICHWRRNMAINCEWYNIIYIILYSYLPEQPWWEKFQHLQPISSDNPCLSCSSLISVEQIRLWLTVWDYLLDPPWQRFYCAIFIRLTCNKVFQHIQWKLLPSKTYCFSTQCCPFDWITNIYKAGYI